MAQDYQIPADQGDSQTAFLNKSNEAMETLRSSFADNFAPTDPAPVDGQLWFDDFTRILHVYSTSDGWIPLVFIDPAASLTSGALLYWAGPGNISTLPRLTAGQIAIGSDAFLNSEPVAATLTGTADEIDITNGNGSITIGIVNPLKVAKGGIGLATATAGDMLTYVSGTAYTAIPKGTANQIIGMNAVATTQEYKTVTAGTGIGVTHGANSITISADAAVTRWVKYSAAHGDFTEAVNGVAQTVTLAALPARTIVSSAVIKTVTAFSGGGLASLDASVGITGNTTAIIGTYDAFAAAGDNNFSGGAGSLYYAGTNLTLTLTPDGAANLAGMNAGSIEIWIETATLPA